MANHVFLKLVDLFVLFASLQTLYLKCLNSRHYTIIKLKKTDPAG